MTHTRTPVVSGPLLSANLTFTMWLAPRPHGVTNTYMTIPFKNRWELLCVWLV